MLGMKSQAPLLGVLMFFSLASVSAVADEKPQTDAYGDPLPNGAIARLGTTRFRHASQVTHAAYSPDGKLLATSGYDQVVRLWDTVTGKEAFAFQLEGDCPYYGPEIVFSPDGKLLAATDGKDGPTFVFGPGGERVPRKRGDKGAVLLWNVSTGKEQLKLDLPPNEGGNAVEHALRVVFGPGGKTLAALVAVRQPGAGVSKYDYRIRVWHAETGVEIRSFDVAGADYRPTMIAASADGKMVAVTQGQGVRLFDLETGKELRTLADEGVNYRVVAFSRDGTLATTTEGGKTIQLWDPATGLKKRLLRGHEKLVDRLAFSANGKRLVSSSSGDTGYQIRVWDVSSGDFVLLHKHKGHVGGGALALSPDGKTVAEGSVNHLHTIHFWDVATDKEVSGPRGNPWPVQFLGLTANGKIVAAGRFSHAEANIWDPASGKLVSALQADGTAFVVNTSPDRKIIAFGGWDGAVSLHDLETGKERITVKEDAGVVHCLAFSPDCKTLAVGHCDIYKGYVCSTVLWDIPSGKKLRRFQLPGRQLRSMVFPPGGNKLITDTDHLHAWDPETGKDLGNVKVDSLPNENHVWRVLLGDGSLLAAGSTREYGLSIWKVATGEVLGRFDKDPRSGGVAFSPDAKMLACGQQDGRIELWQMQAKTSKLVGTAQGPPGTVLALCFSTDGKTLISGHANTTALVWNVQKLLSAQNNSVPEKR